MGSVANAPGAGSSGAFEFATPERLVFGSGVVSRAGELARSLGRRWLLVTGRDVRRAEPLRESFRNASLDWIECTVTGEPTVSDASAGADRAIATRADLLLADEPCAGLNPTETAAMINVLRQVRSSGVTVVLVEHDMPSVMEVSDRILVLDAGQIGRAHV